MLIQKVCWCSRTIEEENSPVLFAVRQDLVDAWPQRCQTYPSCEKNNILPYRFVHRPSCAERSADAHYIIRLNCLHCLCDRTYCTHCVDKMFWLCWITADRNRDLTFAEYGEHSELPAGKRKNVASMLRDKFEGKCIWYFMSHLHDFIELR